MLYPPRFSIPALRLSGRPVLFSFFCTGVKPVRGLLGETCAAVLVSNGTCKFDIICIGSISVSFNFCRSTGTAGTVLPKWLVVPPEVGFAFELLTDGFWKSG